VHDEATEHAVERTAPLKLLERPADPTEEATDVARMGVDTEQVLDEGGDAPRGTSTGER